MKPLEFLLALGVEESLARKIAAEFGDVEELDYRQMVALKQMAEAA
jgi:hypothetical protein